jgi:hypothetical protein
MAIQQARVVGDVSFREGDGVAMPIPRGPCEVTRDELDATISWTENATHGSTAMPLAELERYVKSGALVLESA